MKSCIRAALIVALAVGTSLALAGLSNATDPTLHLEGSGDLSSPTCACSTTSCTGVFTANLTGTPFTTASLNLPLSTGLLPVAGKGGCATATGFGTLNSGKFSVQFYGQVCSDPLRQWFSLSGNVQMVVSPETPGPGTAASGTLVAGGPIHLPCGTSTRSPFSGRDGRHAGKHPGRRGQGTAADSLARKFGGVFLQPLPMTRPREGPLEKKSLPPST